MASAGYVGAKSPDRLDTLAAGALGVDARPTALVFQPAASVVTRPKRRIAVPGPA